MDCGGSVSLFLFVWSTFGGLIHANVGSHWAQVLTCEYFPAGNVLGGYGGNIGEFVG